MDLFELKIRARQLSDSLRSLSWKDPEQRRVLVLLIGGGILVVLVPIVAWRLLAPALTTTAAEQAAKLNEQPARQDPARSAMDKIRDELAPRLRQDERFAGVILRPGASAEAPGALATLQGTVGSRADFDDLIALVDKLSLTEAVHTRISIESR